MCQVQGSVTIGDFVMTQTGTLTAADNFLLTATNGITVNSVTADVTITADDSISANAVNGKYELGTPSLLGVRAALSAHPVHHKLLTCVHVQLRCSRQRECRYPVHRK
jgi:hypothetical protein